MDDFEYEDFDDDWDFDDSNDLNFNNINKDYDNFDDLDFDSLEDDFDFFDEKPLKADSGYEVTAWEVHISEQLTSSRIIRLMNTYPSLKKITCPPSLYNRISPKYLDALSKLNIAVEIKYNYGQKTKYSEDEINQVVDLLKNGKSPKEVSQELGISLKKVHYLKSRYPEYFKLNNYKKKYDDETREKIRQMREKGFKPKEIAEKENIPLRSIYYILNKK